MKSHPLYAEFQKELLSKRPLIPTHNPDVDNTDEWKSLSAQQKGFDLCCSFFNITEE